MITIDSVVTFSLGGIIGFIASELIKDRLARIRGIEAIRIVEFNKGAAEFRAAFVDYIYDIRHSAPNDEFGMGFSGMKEIHTNTVERDHEKAKIRFEPFLDKSDLAGFNASWEKYRQWPEHFKDKDNQYNTRDAILHNIDVLLDYANQK